MVRMNDQPVRYVSRVRARLGSKGNCVLKSTYLAGGSFLPPPRSDRVHCEAASEKTAGRGDYCRASELTAGYPRDLGRTFVDYRPFGGGFGFGTPVVSYAPRPIFIGASIGPKIMKAFKGSLR